MPLLLCYWRRSNDLLQRFQNSLSFYIFTYWKRANELSILVPCPPPQPLLFLSLFLSLPVHLGFLRSQDFEGDFILHWAMKALYKYDATASTLIASAILICLLCCASQHMVERGRKGKGGSGRLEREGSGGKERERVLRADN